MLGSRIIIIMLKPKITCPKKDLMKRKKNRPLNNGAQANQEISRL